MYMMCADVVIDDCAVVFVCVAYTGVFVIVIWLLFMLLLRSRRCCC